MKLLIPKEHCRYRFYVLFSLIIFLLFLDYVLLISIPPLVFVAVLVATAFLGDMDELISVCICCIPWSEAIEWHYVVIFCSIIFVAKYRKKIRMDFGIIPIVLIVIWEMLHCISNEVNIKMLVGYSFLYLFLILLFFVRNMQTTDYSFIMRNFTIAVLVVCCILMFRMLVHCKFNLDSFFMYMQRLGQAEKKVGGMVMNPNSLGILCVFAVGCLIQIRSALQEKTFDILLTVSILVLGALTCSRTYLMCLLILGVFMFTVSNAGFKDKLKIMLGSIIILLISVLMLYLVFPATLDMFIQRFSVEDITSGRGALFVAFNDYLFSSAEIIIFGVGSLNLGDKLTRMSISVGVPHNGIQEILVAWGIMGLVLFTSMILVLIRRSKQENPHQIWSNYALFIIFFVKIMVGQVITSSYTLLSLSLIYLSLCQDCTGKKIDKSL